MSTINQNTAQKIIDEYCQGSSTYELADKYGVWQTSICNLIRGRTWSKCKRPSNIKEIIQSRREKGRFKQGRNDLLHEAYPDLTERQMEILTGSMLGDGNVSKFGRANRNSCFRKKQCLKYKEYVEWHVKELSPFSKKLDELYSTDRPVADDRGMIVERQKVPRYLAAYSARTCSHPVFTEMRKKWYPKNKKIVPKDIQLSPLSVAIWFCDDGCNAWKNREARIFTQSFAIGEAEFLRRLFIKQFDIKSVVRIIVSKKTGKKQPYLKFSSKSYDMLISLIKPYVIWDCMKHKVKWRRAVHQREHSSDLTERNVLEIYELSKTRKQYEIAKKFGIHKNTISSILRGESWKHLFHHCHYIPKSIRR